MKRVLITGATGNIGRKLRAHLEAKGGFQVTLLCLNPDAEEGVVTADLSTYDPAWVGRFVSQDAVVHLAGLPRNQASWADVTPPNIDGLLNVYLAAARHRVPRVVFASSVWSAYGDRFGAGPFDPSIPANPNNPYGATKLMGERVGRAFQASHGIDGVAFRIGACQRGDNIPSTAMTRGDWEQGCWVSNRDICQGLELAITDPYTGHQVLNLASANRNSRWDLSRTREVLGYAPQDSHKVEVGLLRRFQAMAARLGRFALPKVIERVVDARW